MARKLCRLLPSVRHRERAGKQRYRRSSHPRLHQTFGRSLAASRAVLPSESRSPPRENPTASPCLHLPPGSLVRAVMDIGGCGPISRLHPVRSSFLSLNIRFVHLEVTRYTAVCLRVAPWELAGVVASSILVYDHAELNPICTSPLEAFSILTEPVKRLAVITARSTPSPSEICGEFCRKSQPRMRTLPETT